MLERYYTRARYADRVRSRWLGPAIDRYVEWLAARNAARDTVKRSVQALVQFNDFAQSRGATTWDDLPAHVEPFMAQWMQRRGSWCRTAKDRACVNANGRTPVEQLLRLLVPNFVGTQRHIDLPFSNSVPTLFSHLTEERGLRPETLHGYKHHLRAFEAYLGKHYKCDLSALTPKVINDFIIDSAKRLSGSGVRGRSAVLRAFLRYLHREQVTATDLSRAVPRGRNYRQSSVPRSISEDEVERVLQLVDRRDAIGKRDYAILLLLATYGLRAKEVAALQLDDIDWKHSVLHVPERKNGHSTTYPLSTRVGEAIIDYLRFARPKLDHRELFLNVRSPCEPITPVCASMRAQAYIKSAGIKVARPGSHTFRHSCVQRLVDADVSFKVIGDFVGHRLPASTQIYGKVAIHKLRALAIGEAEDLL